MIGDLTPCSFLGRSLSGEKKRCIGGKEVHINKKIVERTLENQSRSNGMEKKAEKEERRP